MKRIYPLFILAALCAAAFAQQPAPAQEGSSTPALSDGVAHYNPPAKPDKAAAYYHYALAHMYEEQMAVYGRSDLANKAIEEYRAAIDADPSSEYLTAALAELYAKTGRIRDAVLEAQDILKKDPKNLEAHKLLGRIYLRSMGDTQNGEGSQNILKLAIEQYEQIVALEPDNSDDHLLLGRLYRLQDDFHKAEAEFKTAVKLDPSSEEAITALAFLYNEEGDNTRATQLLTSIPDAGKSAKLYSALGYVYEQQKDYKKAIESYRHAISLDRDNLDAIRGLAQNLLNDGQTEAALEQYKIIADSNPEDAQTYLHMADIYRKQGDYDQALEDLNKAGSIVSDTVQVPYETALIYHLQGRYDDAIQLLKDLLQKSEKSEKSDNTYTQDEKNHRADILEFLAIVYRDNGNDQLAIDTFHQMLSLGDDSAERGYSGLIDTYREQKDWQQATALAKEATQKLPNDRSLKMVYAAQLADMGQPDTALNQVKALLKGNANPDDRDVYLTLAQMYIRLKRWPEAEQALDQADKLSVKPEDKQAVEYLRATTYEREKKYDQAEAAFRKILTQDPNNAGTLNYLGYMMADHGMQLDEALGFVKKAVQLEPANGAYLDSLGWAYFKLGKYDLAEENLVKATRHAMGNDPTVQEHLGDLYQKTGRLKQAVTHWEHAMQEWNRTVAPEVDTEDVAKLQKKLESAKVRLAKEQVQK